MKSKLISKNEVPGTDGVRCFRFTCGHERILSRADARTEPAECVQCKYERLSAYRLVTP
jgi:hypothetical protein